MPLLQLPDKTGELDIMLEGWQSTGDGVNECIEPFIGDLPIIEGDTAAIFLAGEAACVGLGGTGGVISLPLSDMFLASFPLSRLQLLGVVFTALSGAERFGSLRGKVFSPM